MALRTFSHICVSYDEAVQYVYELEHAGIPASAVSVIGSDTDARIVGTKLDDRGESPAAIGATLGTAIGGGVGLLAGLGALTIPGLGPLVAAGWLIATLAGAGVGAAAGGLVGALVQAGMGPDEARDVAMAVENGRYVVLARVEDDLAAIVQQVFANPLPEAARQVVRDPRLTEPGDPTDAATSVTPQQSSRTL